MPCPVQYTGDLGNVSSHLPPIVFYSLDCCRLCSKTRFSKTPLCFYRLTFISFDDYHIDQVSFTSVVVISKCDGPDTRMARLLRALNSVPNPAVEAEDTARSLFFKIRRQISLLGVVSHSIAYRSFTLVCLHHRNSKNLVEFTHGGA